LNYISQTIIGSQIFRFDELTSTNDKMRELLEENIPKHGAIVITGFQTNGRGQFENTWESEDCKNLLLSFFIEPNNISATEQVYINLFVSLSVFDFVNTYFPGRTKIKWPNDIYVDGKKIAGLLIENSIQGNIIKNSIIGVGLNINQEYFIAKNATSFYALSANELSLELMFNELINCFNFRFEELSLPIKSKLLDDYLNVMFRKNILAKYNINGHIIDGEIIGIDHVGRLKLVVEGELKTVTFKEISYE
jgi:BirA family transcriptional regulator, biotin operon repressor / biotin---[acetyl-CoA-carboxylase] ligase